MREAINSNPVVQISILGAALLIGALFFMMRGGGSAEPVAPPSAASGTAAGAVAPDGSSSGATAPSAATAGGATTGASLSPATTSVSPEALIPGPGLPAPVVKAYRGGKAIVLLIVRGRGIDDKLVRRSVAELQGDSRLEIFVARARNIARYSRITTGVGVSRVPALVVIRPRKISGATPQAQVSYGFRSSQSVVQAVRDALYRGPSNLPYHPG